MAKPSRKISSLPVGQRSDRPMLADLNRPQQPAGLDPTPLALCCQHIYHRPAERCRGWVANHLGGCDLPSFDPALEPRAVDADGVRQLQRLVTLLSVDAGA